MVLDSNRVIDLTLSSDDEGPTHQHAHPIQGPINHSEMEGRPMYNVSPIYTSIAQEPIVPSNHGLPSNGFFSYGPLYAPPNVPGFANTYIPSSTYIPTNRSNEEHAAKRMRIGERPSDFASSYLANGSSAMPEVPLNILDRAIRGLASGISTMESDVSPHHALNLHNEASSTRPRKPMPRNDIPVSDARRERQVGAPKNSRPTHGGLIGPESRMPHDPHDQAPIRNSSSEMQILEWRKKESPQHKIVRNAQKIQIFPHIRGFLHEFSKGVPDDEARRIGKEVVDKICDEETVRTILTNNGSMPLNYEAMLANRARIMLKRQLEKARNRRLNNGPPGNQPDGNHSTTRPLNPTIGQPHLDLQRRPPISGAPLRLLPPPGERSSSSSDVDAVFDNTNQFHRPTPTTSPELAAELDVPKIRRPDPVQLRNNNSTMVLQRPPSGHHPRVKEKPKIINLISPQASDESELSELSLESEDEDITADVQAYLKSLKTPSVVNSPVKATFEDNLSRDASLIKSQMKRDRLEREERQCRLFGLDLRSSRPYLSAQARADIQKGLDIANKPSSKYSLLPGQKQLLCDSVLHVDFADEEMAFMADLISMVLGIKIPAQSRERRNLRDDIVRMMKGRASDISEIVSVIQFDGDKPRLPLALRLIKRRGKAAIKAFLEDAIAGTISRTTSLVVCPARRRLSPLDTSKSSMGSLLRQREIFGKSRRSGSEKEVKVELISSVEDTIVPYRQWMDCSGDVIALAWNSDGTSFVCGATAHSDYHNQQYNKPGNLIFGAISSEVTRARPDHKIPRPVVVKGDNSLEAMRETQDPWLYSSVVSAAYSSAGDKFFTSSFDKTVKVWGRGLDETQPELLGTWRHDGNVNFVVTSENHGYVATACDIVRDAIRVYEVNGSDVTNSRYITYSGMKANEQVAQDDKTWAYYPATIAWARCPLVSQLLLVGYSPRSTGMNENDIPEEKANLGELCLWDVAQNKRIDVWPRSQNVFEVVWHPTLPVFLAATAPSGTFEPWVRTQIRVFTMNERGGFTQTEALDCCALDINEITIMPNSGRSSYVTACCTDGKVYVWDTGIGDKPIHILEHGSSIDDRHYIDLPDELSDNGVKFSAWGSSVARFYTGSSDGLIKAWDVRKPRGQAFIRDVARLSGGVSSGSFSPDFTHLLIGDATGKIHLLKIDDTEEGEESMKVKPKLVTPHPQPDEDSMWAGRGGEISSELVRSGVIVLDGNKEIGAVQGPNYSSTNWFCRPAHENNDPTNPLLPEFATKQAERFSQITTKSSSRKENLVIPELGSVAENVMARFVKGKNLDFDQKMLEGNEREVMEREKWQVDNEWEVEERDLVGGRLVRRLRKGEDWEEDWVELEVGEWEVLE